MNFPFGTNGKFIILGVPIFKHIRVICSYSHAGCFAFSMFAFAKRKRFSALMSQVDDSIFYVLFNSISFTTGWVSCIKKLCAFAVGKIYTYIKIEPETGFDSRKSGSFDIHTFCMCKMFSLDRPSSLIPDNQLQYFSGELCMLIPASAHHRLLRTWRICMMLSEAVFFMTHHFWIYRL